MPKQTGFALLMGANVCAIIGAMAGGLLSDRIGRIAAENEIVGTTNRSIEAIPSA